MYSGRADLNSSESCLDVRRPEIAALALPMLWSAICAHPTTSGLFAGIGLRHVAARSVGLAAFFACGYLVRRYEDRLTTSAERALPGPLVVAVEDKRS
jgi:hypothetical protein